MDSAKKEKIENYIEKKEKAEQEWKLNDSTTVAWIQKETKEDLNLFQWLRNDKDLLTYAEMVMKNKDLNIKDSLNFGLLEFKLSLSCPFFEDFKEFLKELKAWKNTSWKEIDIDTYINWESKWESKWNSWEWTTWNTDKKTDWKVEKNTGEKREFCWTPVTQIQSLPFERSGARWITWCSKTARWNGENFWLKLPRGNAYDAGKKSWKDCLWTIPSNKQEERSQNKREWISAENFNSNWKWNFADIYTNSKSNYWHRASAFKDGKWQRYVLDPYTRVNWLLDNTPKKLEDYLKVRKIVKSHFYESKWYKWSGNSSQLVESSDKKSESTDSNVEQTGWKVGKAIQWALDIANDDSYWYEWGGRGNKNGKKGYDCASLVCTAFKEAWFDVPVTWCSPMQKNFEKVWFKWIPWPIKSEDVKTWDIILEKKKHVELCVWDNKIVWAHTNKDGKSWDSSWNEISVRSTKSVLGYMKPDWILRFTWESTA